LHDFARFYRRGGWKSGGEETRCGAGSTVEYTENIRRQLPDLLKRLNVKRMIDAGCGDRNWISKVDLGVEYIGIDIVPELADIHLDIAEDKLPPADLVMTRFVFNHMSTARIQRALDNIDAKYLLAGTHPHVENTDIIDGDYRHINLEREPFSLKALEYITDHAKRHETHWMALFSL